MASYVGYKIVENNGKFRFELYPSNSRNTPIGVSVEYSDYRKCKKAMNDFVNFVIFKKIDSEKSEFVKIIKNDGKYIYEYYYKGKKIFYRQISYEQLESCKKIIKSIYKNINEFTENDLEKKGKGEW